MSQDLTVDLDFIANNIQTYIEQDNFYDIVDKDDISKVDSSVSLSMRFFKKA